ncbi:MAG: hypothetical protein HXS47_06650 [Theionarchaea archaeon]|nr:hypothetical protein [Theionarchaea archaeon]
MNPGLYHCMISVIFVEPESSGNVGSIARCIENFGADKLILVNPCALEGAQKMAMHAEHMLNEAIITETFEQALSHVDVAVATTSKTGGFNRRAHRIGDIPSFTESVKLGIVIGRESSGLTNAEIEQCDILVSVPTCESYPTLNAAIACCIILYELTKDKKEGKIPRKFYRKKIMEEFDRISDIIERRPHRKRIWKMVMKRIIYTTQMSERETTVFLGFMRRVRTVVESRPWQKN